MSVGWVWSYMGMHLEPGLFLSPIHQDRNRSTLYLDSAGCIWPPRVDGNGLHNAMFQTSTEVTELAFTRSRVPLLVMMTFYQLREWYKLDTLGEPGVTAPSLRRACLKGKIAQVTMRVPLCSPRSMTCLGSSQRLVLLLSAVLVGRSCDYYLKRPLLSTATSNLGVRPTKIGITLTTPF